MLEKLSHLSVEEISILIDEYYAGAKTNDLIEKYGIDVSPGNLFKTFPPKVQLDLSCPYCTDVNMATSFESRSSSSWHKPLAKCMVCLHVNSKECQCSNCIYSRKERMSTLQNQQKLVLEEAYFESIGTAPSIRHLSLADAVFLLSIVRHKISENYKFVYPYQEGNPELAPTYDLVRILSKRLFEIGLIAINPETPISAIVFDDNTTYIKAYYPTQIYWELLPGEEIVDKRAYVAGLEELVQNEQAWPDHWVNQIETFWGMIAKYECIQYLEYLLLERDFSAEEIGEKTHHTFENLLKTFSVAQIFNLSWQSVRDTTDYLVTKGIPRRQASNVFTGVVQRKADKALAEGWTIRDSRRDFNCPQTVVSAVWNNVFLKMGDKAFSSVIVNGYESSN